MKITIGGVEMMNHVAPMATQALDTFKTIPTNGVLLNAVPTINIDHMGDILIDLGQQILLGASGVVVVVCGILIAVGLKREGWKRVISIIQGLGVGLVGPTVVAIVAGFFAGFAKMIS